MAPSNFLRLFTIFSLAILNISLDALPANALVVEPGHMARGVNHAHAGIAKKRSNSKQCKPRPVPAISSTSSTTSHHSVAVVANAHLATPAPSSQLSTHETTTTSHSSTPSAAASSSGSCSNKKVGLGWSNHEQSSLHNFVTPCTHYISNWDLKYHDPSVASQREYSQLEFVPTIARKELIPNIPLLTKGFASKVKGWNEPEISGQADMSPQEGCSLWKLHIDPLAQLGYELIAPSVTTGPAGFNWLKTFMGLCKDSKIRNIDIHFYGLDAGDLETAVNKFHDAFGLNIWVGEIGCVDYYRFTHCTQSIFDGFYPKAVHFLETTSFVEMYAWFGMFRADELPNNVPAANSMITCPDLGDLSKCKPNSLGYQYLNP